MSQISEQAGSPIEPCYIELGRWLKSERNRLGLTQKDVSIILGMSRPSVSNFEVGRQRLLYHQVLQMKELITEASAAEYLTSVRTLEEEERILAQADAIKRARAALGSAEG